ncbi:MAG: glycosyltransferase family 2 protein [Bacteroidota bacterium]
MGKHLKHYLFSVVISTYNRLSVLLENLTTLDLNEIKNNNAQIIIIENSSTAKIFSQLKTFETEFLKVFYLKDAGLSKARNYGASVSEGDFLIFLDDDAFPQKGWLDAFSNYIQNQNSDVDLLAGKIIPDYCGKPLPEWLPSDFEWIYGKLDYGEKTKHLGNSEIVNGGNFCIRRTIFKDLGGFDPLFGHVGECLGGSEEQHLQDRYERKYHKPILYVPGAAVLHKFDRSRLSEEWAQKRVASAVAHSFLRDRQNRSRFYILTKSCSYVVRFPFVSSLKRVQCRTYLRTLRKNFISSFFSSKEVSV